MDAPSTILLACRNRVNLSLMKDCLAEAGYRSCEAASLEDLQAVLQSNLSDIRVALLDLTGFSPDIWTCCEHLRNSAIPFLLISAQSNPRFQMTGVEHGAAGVLTKPLLKEQLLKLITNLMEA